MQPLNWRDPSTARTKKLQTAQNSRAENTTPTDLRDPFPPLSNCESDMPPTRPSTPMQKKNPTRRVSHLVFCCSTGDGNQVMSVAASALTEMETLLRGHNNPFPLLSRWALKWVRYSRCTRTMGRERQERGWSGQRPSFDYRRRRITHAAVAAADHQRKEKDRHVGISPTARIEK